MALLLHTQRVVVSLPASSTSSRLRVADAAAAVRRNTEMGGARAQLVYLDAVPALSEENGVLHSQ